MGTCCDAYFFKNRKEFKKAIKNYKLGIKQEYNTIGCFGACLSNILHNNDYDVTPDLIEVLLSKSDLEELKQKYKKDSFEYEELERLRYGFEEYTNCEVVYLGYFCE